MSPFFDDFETQLREAAQVQIAARDQEPDAESNQAPPSQPRRRGPGWLRAGLRHAPVLAAVAVTLIVAVGAIALLGHGSKSAPTSPVGTKPAGLARILTQTPKVQLRQEFTYIRAAARTVDGTPACRARPTPPPATSDGSPSASLLSKLGVLRRPATVLDRLAGGQDVGLVTVYARYTRLALVRDGVSYYIVPILSDPRAGQPTNACFLAQKAALRRQLSHIPAGLRAPTTALQAAFIAYDEHLLSQPRQDQICFLTLAHNGGSTSCGFSLSQIAHGPTGVQTNGNTVSGVAPNGVASVTFDYPATGALPPLSLTAPVQSNVFVLTVPDAQKRSPHKVTWRSAYGQVLGSVTAPLNRAAFCRAHIIECTLALSVTSGGSGSSYSGSSSSSSSASQSATETVTAGTVSPTASGSKSAFCQENPGACGTGSTSTVTETGTPAASSSASKP